MPSEDPSAAKPVGGEVREALDRVLASPGFASKRRGELLRYLVDRTLAGDAEKLTEYAIALDVFGKPDSFDPRSESTIRAEMSRVRKALVAYYDGPGAADVWRFEFPAGGYGPAFVRSGGPGTAAATGQSKTRPRQRAWIVLAFLVVAALVALWRYAPIQPAARSVIVLPFANLTGDPGSEYLADGLTEGLTDALAHVASLRVVARTSAFQFKGQAIDIREIGRRVNADAVIEGSIRKVGAGFRVTVQVNRATDGFHILSKVFDGGAHDLGRIESELAAPVLAVLRLGAQAPRSRTPEPEALDLVLRARALRGYNTTGQFERTVELLNQAIQRDPQYGGAWAELASVYAGAATSISKDPRGSAAQAKAAAARAIDLDPASAEAYAAEGFVDGMVLLDWDQGERELRFASQRMPQNATIHQRLATLLLVQGRFPQALAEARLAEDLDPLVSNSGVAVGMVYFMQRRYGEALAQWRKVLSLHPDLTVLHQFIGMALEAGGDFPGAMAEYSSHASQFPGPAENRIAHLLAVSGRQSEARRRLREIEQTHRDDPLTAAATYGALGDLDRAFASLELAWQRGDRWMLKVHPFLDPLRGDPRYAAFLKRAGFDR